MKQNLERSPFVLCSPKWKTHLWRLDRQGSPWDHENKSHKLKVVYEQHPRQGSGSEEDKNAQPLTAERKVGFHLRDSTSGSSVMSEFNWYSLQEQCGNWEVARHWRKTSSSFPAAVNCLSIPRERCMGGGEISHEPFPTATINCP